MSLPVPLTVRVGDHHITQQVQSLSFRREAVGGVRSISFNLARSLADLTGLDSLSKVYVYDGRTGQTVAEGRLTDTGRGVNADGQKWDCVAFGPAQHASDITAPLIYVDKNISDAFGPIDVVLPSIQIGYGPKPGETSAAPPQGVLVAMPEGLEINSSSRGTARYIKVQEAGQKFARVSAAWESGASVSTVRIQMFVRTDGGGATFTSDKNATEARGTTPGVVVTNFPDGSNTLSLRLEYTGAAFVLDTDAVWAWWWAVSIRTMLKTKTGTDITTGYTADTVLASEVVADLLGRRLNQFDRANATIATTTVAIQQLAYTEGVTAAQVLGDLMKLEPAYRWYTTPDTTGNGYGFRWELWPTTVRYEATLDDGGSFPISTQDLCNEVGVTYKDIDGTDRYIVRTMSCALLTGAGLTRRAQIDAGSEIGGLAGAQAIGDSFLDEHNVPKNSGTLTVARPIRDVISGAMVQPWEIEAGELVRVLGVEAYPDAFNVDTNDGEGVFRIHAVDYTTEGNTATLALDSDPRETEDALVKLLNQRSRR